MKLNIDTLSLTMVLCFWLISGGCQKSSLPISVVDHRQAVMKKCSRIDIESESIEQGLRELFTQIAEQYGPFDSEPIIQDYTPLIQHGLYLNGFCSIQNLKINAVIFDIDIFFLTERTPSSLNIVAFQQGNSHPVLSLSNHYYVQAQ
jgi:hypothetical protein